MKWGFILPTQNLFITAQTSPGAHGLRLFVPNAGGHGFSPWLGKICMLCTQKIKQKVSKLSTFGLPWWLRQWRICQWCWRPGFGPWVGRSPGEGNGNPLQYSCLKNSMDRGAPWATVHGVQLDMTDRLTHTCAVTRALWVLLTGASQVALVVKNLPAKARDSGGVTSLLELGRSPGRGHGNPLQYSCLENPMDRGAWRAAVHKVTQSWTWLKRLSTQHSETLIHYISTIIGDSFIPFLCPQNSNTALPILSFGRWSCFLFHFKIKSQ